MVIEDDALIGDADKARAAAFTVENCAQRLTGDNVGPYPLVLIFFVVLDLDLDLVHYALSPHAIPKLSARAELNLSPFTPIRCK